MQITTLIEDRPGSGALAHEFGLSLYIETGDTRILLDTGQTGAFADNARALGIDLGLTDLAVISHGHFDHGGGLGRLLKDFPQIPVHLHKWAMGDFYANIGSKLSPGANRLFPHWLKSLPPFRRYIGLPREAVEAHAPKFKLVNRTWHFRDDISLVTHIPLPHPMPRGNDSLLARDQGKLIPDGFVHEIILVLKEADGLTLITGCCHKGILNIINAMAMYFPGIPIKAVVGGFHLKKQSDEEVEALAQALADTDIPRIITGHCTGDAAQAILAKTLGNRLEALVTGSIHEI